VAYLLLLSVVIRRGPPTEGIGVCAPNRNAR
jgi:hypothetical protein